MDIQQLRYFLAVADELHFGKAAERLHITASPLSRRVRELEQELGRDLFIREHHHVELTQFGEVFRGRAQDAVSVFDGLRRLPDEHLDVPRCRIGAAPLAPAVVLDRVLETYHRVVPDADLPVTLAPSAETLVMLSADRIDLAVVHLPVDTDGVESLLLSRAPYAVAMRSDDDLADRSSLRLRDLRRRQVLVTSAKVHPQVMGETRSALLEAGVTRLVQLPHNDVVQMAAHVLRTGALSLTVMGADTPATRIFAPPHFTVVPLDEPTLVLRAGMAWRAGAESRVPGLRSVVESLRTRYGTRPMSP
ncbi:LysR family transcriptional regulator [Streptomyces sp. SID4956]|uniref:LysR family transcriptional regulator n=1 Tax=Streptomyces sp. SID4956 TaxID=2690290 RepID=UPI001370D778|nr:LysR family transcriptional regulator [Streptomyces sp. SID4956]